MLVFMYIMSPVSYPIAMLLDSWLGVHHGTTYRRTELKTLVSLHQVDRIGELTDDEVTIIASVLDLKEKAISTVMTPLEDVFTLSEDAILDEHLMEEIVNAGHSRIPIYRHDDPNNFIGMLLVKRLITYDPEDHIPVRQFKISSLPEAAPNTNCLDILNFFQEGRSHMAIVTSEPGGFGHPIGVITLEDVIEELLGEEIVDESDVYVDIHNKIRVIRKPSKNVKMIKSLKSLLQSPAISDASPLLGNKGTGSDRRTVTMPIENNYMATGKTILLRNPSATLLDKAAMTHTTNVNTAANAHISTAPTEHEESSSTVVSPKPTTANGNKDSPVVNFKDQVKVVQEMASKDTPEDNHERSVTIEVPDTNGGVYMINPPSDAAVADAAGDVVSTHVQVLPETPTSPEATVLAVVAEGAKEEEEAVKEEVTPRSVEVQMEAERPTEVLLTEEPTAEVTTSSSNDAGLPGSESTSTLLSSTTVDDNPAVNPPGSSSSKKRKNKKKKSTK
jgi:Mg2+/Co2+ transporter CorC